MSLAASKAKDRSRRRPPDFRRVAIGRALPDDMPKRREVEADAGDAQFLSGYEFEHLLSRLRCCSRIDVVGDARVGEGELHSWKVDDVAPDEKRVGAGLNEPCPVARSVSRCWESADARSDFVRLDRADAIAIGGKRRASQVEIALAFRGRARHRPVAFPKGEFIFVQDELRRGKYSLSR